MGNHLNNKLKMFKKTLAVAMLASSVEAEALLGGDMASWAPEQFEYEQKYDLGVNDVEEFVMGLMEGLIQKDSLPEIQKCMKNTSTVATEVNKIVNEMSAGTMQAIIQGVKDLATLIQELPTDLKDCENIQDDVSKITKWGQQFISPTGLGHIVENVMANWSSIQQDIGAIQAHIKGSQYEMAGESTADVIILAAGKIQYAKINEEVNKAILASSEMY